MHEAAVKAAQQDHATLLASARRGDGDAFQRLAEPYRREIQLHCYRMTGCISDAEDLTQETFLRAWRGVERFEGRASFRGWLYRIATNACLDDLARRGRAPRVLAVPGAASESMPSGGPAGEIPWLDPCPDAALDGIADAAPGPEARYEQREAVHLAFVAAIQHLPPRQRAVLLLHDVLGWSAEESARLIDSSAASVNSALQRARAALKRRLPAGQSGVVPAQSHRQRALLDRYLQAWERTDVDAFVALLREDVVLSMPPWRSWYSGRAAVGRFFAWTSRPGGHGPFRLVQTAANRQPAFAFYSRWQGPAWLPHSIQVLTLREGSISAMTSFVMPALFPVFGLPPEIPKP